MDNENVKADEVGQEIHPVAPPLDSTNESRAHRARSNRRVAWTLLALSLVFFAGIIASRLTGDSKTGLTVLGIAVTLFLIVAIGRNLRK